MFFDDDILILHNEMNSNNAFVVKVRCNVRSGIHRIIVHEAALININLFNTIMEINYIPHFKW